MRTRRVCLLDRQFPVNLTDRRITWQELSQDFHNRVSKLGFHEFRVSNSLIEKVKIITMSMYISTLTNKGSICLILQEMSLLLF